MFKNKSDEETILILIAIAILCMFLIYFICTKIEEDKSGGNNMNTYIIDPNADNGYNEETDSIELYLNNEDHTKISIPISELIEKDLIKRRNNN